MSNADQGTREWRFYIQDMIEFGEKVLSYTEGMDQAETHSLTMPPYEI